MQDKDSGGLARQRVKTLPQSVEAPARLACRRERGIGQRIGRERVSVDRQVKTLPQFIKAPQGLPDGGEGVWAANDKGTG